MNKEYFVSNKQLEYLATEGYSEEIRAKAKMELKRREELKGE